MEPNGPINLHDATLLSVEVTWPAKTVRITFRQGGGKRVLLSVLGLRSRFVPRDEPWGPSVSVGTVRETTGRAGPRRIEIEMQSGDTIRVEADEFTWS
jgi:hypothetical protein